MSIWTQDSRRKLVLQSCGERRAFPQMDSCLTPHPRINSREMADLNVEGKIIKHIQVMQEVSPASSSTHGFPK